MLRVRVLIMRNSRKGSELVLDDVYNYSRMIS